METPKIVALNSTRDLVRLVGEHAAEHYTRVNSGYKCNACGEGIRSVTTYITLHLQVFSTCAGPGQVVKVDLPYCPKCEPTPDTFGCVHLPLPAAQGRLLALS